ncbi:MAG: UDP-N-acetylmuramate--L-alanine ligase [Nanoarchaeota archaeon]|nr:UDP-N-acetylmuramate--L-alanine ligase [Nanoarchaeota archaeon]
MKKKRVHMVGIGGIGMSALARYFLAQNWAVSGSDLQSSSIIHGLSKLGIKVKIGHKISNVVKGTHLVIRTVAVLLTHPEIQQAERLGIPVKTYPEALGEITKKYETIGVAGAHGKSTTTSLLALAMIRAKMDPTVFVGTKLWEFGDSNFYLGESPYLVVEADEYGGAFLHYSPAHAIVLNIDKEHLDYYGTFAEVQRAFLGFIANVRPGGIVVLNKDNVALWGLVKRIFAIAKKRDLSLFWYSLNNPAASRIRKALRIPGEHNVSNALAAYTLLRALKVPARDILFAFSRFMGSWRRMEHRGLLKIQDTRYKTQVFDDYAHHPTEIKATLRAFREKFPKKKIVCVFQPHQMKRLQLLFSDFADAFEDADLIILLSVYQVAGREQVERFKLKVERVDLSKKLVKEIRKRHSKLSVEYFADTKNFRKKMVAALSGHIHSSAVLVMMGAGDIFQLTDKLIEK